MCSTTANMATVFKGQVAAEHIWSFEISQMFRIVILHTIGNIYFTQTSQLKRKVQNLSPRVEFFYRLMGSLLGLLVYVAVPKIIM